MQLFRWRINAATLIRDLCLGSLAAMAGVQIARLDLPWGLEWIGALFAGGLIGWTGDRIWRSAWLRRLPGWACWHISDWLDAISQGFLQATYRLPGFSEAQDADNDRYISTFETRYRCQPLDDLLERQKTNTPTT